jgi:hypothetical protein
LCECFFHHVDLDVCTLLLVLERMAQAENLEPMDGADLAVVLEGRVTLRECLELKLRKASHEGVVFHRLSLSDAA